MLKFTRQKKKKSIQLVMKTSFPEEKLMKQFGNPFPLLRESPLLTNPHPP